MSYREAVDATDGDFLDAILNGRTPHGTRSRKRREPPEVEDSSTNRTQDTTGEDSKRTQGSDEGTRRGRAAVGATSDVGQRQTFLDNTLAPHGGPNRSTNHSTLTACCLLDWTPTVCCLLDWTSVQPLLPPPSSPFLSPRPP